MSEAGDVPRGGDVGEGTATIPNEVFNLVKSIVGAGVLSLPAGNMRLLYNLLGHSPIQLTLTLTQY